ncbi:hypothetical protein [Paenibacillus pabuli]|uniref:hypothetical protein n=1 Tax=Paenibacillus pabuli TaxID=1472 RepID=UPI00078120D8|nr:hypothetical protein [Paenibacillus pabuli]MEC0124644.1 hypothetical protein [Paenibacillus pabuli]
MSWIQEVNEAICQAAEENIRTAIYYKGKEETRFEGMASCPMLEDKNLVLLRYTADPKFTS